MARIRGLSVTLYKETLSGYDNFGAPIYTTTKETVNNVLVAQPSTDDVTSAVSLYGKKIAFNLGIPKGDANTWYDTFVIVRGERCRTIGKPVYGTPENMPMWWGGKVAVERYGG